MSQVITANSTEIVIAADAAKQAVLPIITTATSIRVIDTASQAEAVSIAKQLKQAEDELEKRYRALKDPLNVLAKNVDSLFREPREAIKALRSKVSAALSDYQLRIEREAEERRREEERKRQEELARLERERLAKEVEAKRLADEAAKLAEPEAAPSLDDFTADAVADLSLDSLQADIAANDAAAEAEKARQAVVVAQAAPVEVIAPPKKVAVEGGGTVSFVSSWEFEVTDPKAVPRDFLKVDEVAIRKAVKDGAREIAGVRIFEVRRPVVRT